MLVGGVDHDDVGPFGRFLVGKHLEAGGLGLFGGGRAGAECDRDFLHAAVAHVLRVGVALAAIADDGDLLALDQFLVGVAIVINLHVCLPYSSSVTPDLIRGPAKRRWKDRKSTRLNSSH